MDDDTGIDIIDTCGCLLFSKDNCVSRSTCIGLASGITTAGIILVAFMIWWLQALVSWSYQQTFDDLPYELHQQMMTTGRLENGESPRQTNDRRKKSKRHSPTQQVTKAEEETALERFFGYGTDVAPGGIGTEMPTPQNDHYVAIIPDPEVQQTRTQRISEKADVKD